MPRDLEQLVAIFTAQIDGLRSELRGDIRELRGELRAGLDRMGADLGTLERRNERFEGASEAVRERAHVGLTRLQVRLGAAGVLAAIVIGTAGLFVR